MKTLHLLLGILLLALMSCSTVIPEESNPPSFYAGQDVSFTDEVGSGTVATVVFFADSYYYAIEVYDNGLMVSVLVKPEGLLNASDLNPNIDNPGPPNIGPVGSF